jgi:phage baseplate assembly protein W
MTDFGRDLWCDGDTRPDCAEVTGLPLVAQAVIRRWETPRGGCFYDPNYGEGLLDLVHQAGITGPDVASLLERGSMKDERVDSASAEATIDVESETITATVRLETSLGPFSMTVSIDALRVEQLTMVEG